MEIRNSGNRDAGYQQLVAITCVADFRQAHPQAVLEATTRIFSVLWRALPLRLRLGASPRRVAETSVRAGAGLEANARTVSLALGGSLNPPPRLLVEDKSGGGGLGMVFSPG
jgi:hypothetical protein